MKNYKAILTILKSEMTAKNRFNKMTAIQISTEDKEFSKLIKIVATCFSEDAQSKNPSTKEWWDTEYLKRVPKLISYIEEVIKNNKPEWQVLAEKNGWIAPGK